MPSKMITSLLFVLSQGLATAEAEESSGQAGDDVVVVMWQENAELKLSRDQISDIFLGRLRQLPGGRRVVPLDMAEGSALREQFYREVLERTPAQVRAHWARLVFTGRGSPPRSVDSPEDAVMAIAEDSRIVAYLWRRDVDGSLAVVYE